MTKAQYQAYQASIAQFLGREDICCTSTDSDRPYFSWRNCECCDRPTGGTRLTMSAIHNPSNEILTYEICIDCEYYLEYGRLDDATMLDIESEGK